MPITIIGVNHKTASVDIREKVAFSPANTQHALQSLLTIVNEGLILSTCNRTEIYVVSGQDTNSSDKVSKWLADFHQLDNDDVSPYLYQYNDSKAVQHSFRVACGLDSMVLGEPQILGQLKGALQCAKDQKSTGRTLNRLLQQTFSTAKKIRTETSIGANAVSIAYAAVSLAKRIFSNLAEQTALLVGAGETIELVANHLQTQGIKHIIVANRSIANAEKLAERFGGTAIALASLGEHLQYGDIIISSTASPLPVIGKGSIERALKMRKYKPMFMVDIAIPRDIEPEVNQLDDAYLYTVDDLQSVIKENMKSRHLAAEQAEVMIEDDVKQFMDWLRAQEQINIIQEYRHKVDTIRQETLNKSLRLLENGKDSEEVIRFMAHQLSNKLSHDATKSMNQAAHQGDTDLLAAARQLLNLEKK